MPSPVLILLTKQHCHLCEAARLAVARVANVVGIGWQDHVVDDDPVLLEKYAEELPVVLVDGIQRDFWTVDEARLERLLRQGLQARA
ncbi:glutaredoxin family protein [Pseudarthrobacter sp. PS3-L1]|uniref:glutaredoxin family protein n=1 Tax=Pseudarthrobacter sp. PS3-L1 TaxID=3046207 RepID=UPI0024BB2C65|nr:glutaredoxin family protein [Pseudarthrobacter sp. PS3-L1]MDJ0319271.1 glutaredoxin family protein [Pseudarthrobacter sp. PS3-L1]